MARRVNTKFVVLLVASVGTVCVVLLGVLGLRWYHNHDPATLKARGEVAEKAGRLKEAAGDYGRAANQLSQKHELGADELYVRAAELSMKISQSADNVDDAINFYDSAIADYQAASTENPLNKVANEHLLDMKYQDAESSGASQLWLQVEDIASKMIKSEDSARPRAYRAQARLTRVEEKPEGFLENDLKGVDEDIAQSLKLDPKFGLGTALQADLMFDRAKLDLKQAGATEEAWRVVLKKGWAAALALQPATQPATGPAATNPTASVAATARATPDAMLNQQVAGIEAYLRQLNAARSLLDGYLEKNGPDGDVSLVAARIWSQYAYWFGSDETFKETVANKQVTLLEQSLKADPTKSPLYSSLTPMYITNPALTQRGEEFYKQIIKMRPDGPEAYYILADFYDAANRMDDAITEFKEAIKHSQVGSGRQAQQNEDYVIRAKEAIAQTDMDLATAVPQGMTSDKAKAYMKEASDYTENLRASHASKGIVALLDGRALLLNRNLPQAMETLQQAEGFLNGSPQMMGRLVNAKKWRATANELTGQYGKALELINQAIDIKQKLGQIDVDLWLSRGRLQLTTGQYLEARQSAEALLGPEHKTNALFDGTFLGEKAWSDGVRNSALQLWATSSAKLGLNTDAKKVWDRIGQGADDASEILRVASSELNSGENQGAAADANRVLDTQEHNTPEQNISAYQIAIMAQARIGNKDKAKELAAKGMAKYPDEASIQALSARVNSPDGSISLDDQIKIAQGLKDPFMRNVSIGEIMRETDPDRAIKSYQAGEELIVNSSDPKDRDRETDLVGRIFTVSLQAGERADALSAANLQRAGKETAADAKARYTAESKKQSDAAAAFWAITQTYVQKAEKLNLDGVNGKLYRGELEMVKSHGKSGLDLITQTVNQRPDYATGHMMLAQAYLQQKNSGSAMEEFRKVLQLSPTNIEASRRLMELLVPHGNLSDVSLASQTEAKELVTIALRLAPNDAEFQSYADILLTSDTDIDRAIKRREELYARNPDDLGNIEALASLFKRWEDRHPLVDPTTPGSTPTTRPDSPSMKLVTTEFAKHPDSLELAGLMADLLARSGQADRAEAVFDPFISGIDIDIRYEALIDKAQICKTIGRVQDAAAALNDAMKIQPPGNDQAQRVLGDMYYEVGNMADAVKVYRELAQGIPDEDSRNKVIRRMIEGELQLGNYSDADSLIATMDKRLEELYKQKPEYKKDLVELLLLQGFSDIGQRNLPKSLEVINRVLTMEPGNPNALFERARANWTLGEKPKVKDSVVSDLIAARDTDKSIQSRLYLAKICVQTQDYAEASVMYDEAIAMRPDVLGVRVEYMQYLMKLVRFQKEFSPTANQSIADEIRKLGPADKMFKVLKDTEAHFSDPDHQLQWWLMYAQLLELQGNLTQAQSFYKQLYDNLPNKVEVCDAYIASLLATKNYDTAVSVSTTVITQNAPLIESHPNLVVFYLRRAAANRGLGKQDLAADDIDRAFAIVAREAIARHSYERYLSVLGQATAILPNELLADRLKARVAANPTETISQLALLQTLMLLDRPQDAIAIAQTIHAPQDDVALRTLALRQTGTAFFMAKKYDQAEASFTELVEKVAPNDVDGLNNFAYMLADGMGKPKDGIKYAQRAIQALDTQSDPDNIMTSSATVYDTLGWAQYLDGQNGEAVKTLHNSLAWQKLPATYLHLGKALFKAGNYNDASDAAREGVALAALTHDENLPGLQKLQDDVEAIRKQQSKAGNP